MRVVSKTPFLIVAAVAITFLSVRVLLLLTGCILIRTVSNSIKPGVYLGIPIYEWQRGHLVSFKLPKRWIRFARNTQWLSPTRKLLKPVAALPGDRVCVNKKVRVNGVAVGPVYTRDRQGKRLPRLHKCFTLKEGEFFPLSLYNPHSFDGRYMGALQMSSASHMAKSLFYF